MQLTAIAICAVLLAAALAFLRPPSFNAGVGQGWLSREIEEGVRP